MTENTNTDQAGDKTDVADLDAGESVVALAPEHEVEQRSADQTKPSLEHTKIFVLGPTSGYAKGYDHEPNKAATRQYAIDQGMWPTGDVKFVSAKTHADGVSLVLTYKVPVIPAHDAPEESPNPEVIADDTDKGGATKAQNADASA